ncbi:MAG: TonB-dependent receptor [Alphaproteobacteria bacterium]
MGSDKFAKRLRYSAAIGAVIIATACPAVAQTPPTDNTVEQTKPPQGDSGAPKTEVIVVTGSRIQNQFTSASPMSIIQATDAAPKGISDLASLLRDSTVASGSPQITAITSTAFVQNGGTGVDSISLRGLGANRTLVLLDGKRAGPAGTRGSVGAFDLNVIPLSAIERVDILKEGASSIYGSDAVAGVVNIITKKTGDSSIDAFYSAPTHGGGDEFRINGTYGAEIGNFHFRITGDYYKKQELVRGDRDFFDCGTPYVFGADGKRADLKDPRTGQYSCSSDLPWGHVWYYDYGADAPLPWESAPGLIQYNYGNNLQNHIPGFGLGTANGLATPPNWFPVSYGALTTTGTPGNPYIPSALNSSAVTNYHSPFQDVTSLSPGVERMTVFGSGEYDLGDHAQLYGNVLLNRRTTQVSNYRQFWSFQYIYSDGAGGYDGDPLAIADGWQSDAGIYSPTSITDHSGDTTQVDYVRALAGIKGDFSLGFLKNWNYDASLQFSNSRGTYKEDFIWDDAITPYQFRNSTCAASSDPTTPYRGIPCVDINWFDPQFLAGDLTAQQKAFLFGVSKGHTTYQEASFEGYVSGDLFKLPAGPVSMVLGYDYQDDRLNDTPSQVTQDGAAWGSSQAGITKGRDHTQAAFTEFSVPLLKDIPAIKALTLSASGRYTDVSSYGSQSTYKLGLNWEVTPWLRFRGSQGTSFRSPALFELYLFNQTAFGTQRDDPCVNWGTNLAAGAINQRIADACAADGIPSNHTSAGISPTIFSSGGAGSLKAETSTSKNLGVVLSPTLPSKFGSLQFSVDYYDIEVENEVTQLGEGNILFGCYNSLNHATDPLCSLFNRDPGTLTVDTVTDNYINIATQHNRGLDIEALYKVDLPVGSVSTKVEFSRGLEVSQKTLPSSDARDFNGEIGNPQWVGNVDVTYELDKWDFFLGLRYVGDTSNAEHFGSQPQTYFGQPVRYVLNTDAVWYTDISVSRELPGNLTARLGVSNVFDQEPPQVTTIANEYSTIGNVPLDGSQYDFFGRSIFLNVTKKF